MFALPSLPFEKHELEPHMSAKTFDYHYGKHHQAYVNNLNSLIEKESKFQGLSLEKVITESYHNHEGIFNNAAQVWNHAFFWHCLSPNGGGKPNGQIATLLNETFGDYENFAEAFKKAATTQFGSGWAWLVFDKSSGKVKIIKTANAETPITDKNLLPMITCDVWEHAYYLDYQNSRPGYVDAYLNNLVNWDFAEKNLEKVALFEDL